MASSEIGCKPSFESLISPSLRRSAPSRRSYAPLDASEVTGLRARLRFLVLPPCFPGCDGRGGEATNRPEWPFEVIDFLK
jgi:hypothetical protein